MISNDATLRAHGDMPTATQRSRGGVFQSEISGECDRALRAEAGNAEPRQLRCEERCPLARRRRTHAPVAGKSEAPSQDESVEEHGGPSSTATFHSGPAEHALHATPPPSTHHRFVAQSARLLIKRPSIRQSTLFLSFSPSAPKVRWEETGDISLRRRKRISRRLFPPSAAKRGAAETGPDGLASCSGPGQTVARLLSPSYRSRAPVRTLIATASP
ncbi:hypothetical protein HPB50_001909 [Hyalomma asiaticum]|uniref:Uncharacterized protein n=1 Tax=Hyalomma asiaticum TaxID=266040 RepID=A0ACB7TAW9_HYAAI|nr:hypothetical protein HPB50_001909 [Hyalomma asiaticum]